jgi:hypothetical protein
MNLTEKTTRFLLPLVIAAIIFGSYSIFSEHQYGVTISLGFIYILYLYYSGIYKSFYSFGFKSIPYLLVPVILFSLQIALASQHFSEERKIQSMHRFASNALDRDALGEYLLNNIVKEIASDPFIQYSMSNPLLSKHFVRDKIRERYLTSYFDRYHFQIALFKSDGVPADARKLSQSNPVQRHLFCSWHTKRITDSLPRSSETITGGWLYYSGPFAQTCHSYTYITRVDG